MDTLSLPVNAVSYTVAAELSPTDDPFTAPIRNIAQWHFTILAVLMFVVTSLSLSENFLVMFVTFKFKQLRQPLNYIIVNLAIADFLVSLTGGVISFLTNARGYFFLGKWACVLEGFAVTFFGRLNRLFFSSPFIYLFIYLFFFCATVTLWLHVTTSITVGVSVGAVSTYHAKILTHQRWLQHLVINQDIWEGGTIKVTNRFHCSFCQNEKVDQGPVEQGVRNFAQKM